MTITFRNVPMNGAAAVPALLDLSNRQMQQGLAGLRGVVEGQQAQGRQHFNQERDNNTQAFRDVLAQFRSPEELQQAMESGQLQQQRDALGRNIDSNALRGAGDERLAALRTQETAAAQHEDQLNFRNNREARAGVLRDASQGRVDPDAIIAGGFNDPSTMLSGALSTQRDAAAQQRTLEEQGREDVLRRQTRFIDTAASEAIRGFEEASAQGVADIDALTSKHGIPVRNGVPDFSAVNDATRQAYQRDLDNVDALTVSNARRLHERDLRQAQLDLPAAERLTEAQISESGTRLVQRLEDAQQIAALDQQVMDQHRAQVLRNHRAENNTFVLEEPGNPTVNANTAWDNQIESNEQLAKAIDKHGNRRRMRNQIQELATRGLEVDGEFIPLRGSQLEFILQQAINNNFWGLSADAGFKRSIEAYGESDGFKEEVRQFRDVERDLQRVDSANQQRFGGGRSPQALADGLRSSLQQASTAEAAAARAEAEARSQAKLAAERRRTPEASAQERASAQILQDLRRPGTAGLR